MNGCPAWLGKQPLIALSLCAAALWVTPAAGSVPLPVVPPAGSLGAPTAAPPAGHAASGPVARKKKPAQPTYKPVDLNSASRAELITLPGVDAALADKIIANRPFLTKTELVTKKVLPTGPFLALKERVIALPKNRPVAKP
jgi:hypothetical protein